MRRQNRMQILKYNVFIAKALDQCFSMWAVGNFEGSIVKLQTKTLV